MMDCKLLLSELEQGIFIKQCICTCITHRRVSTICKRLFNSIRKEQFMKKIGIVVGSLRGGSYNRHIANYIAGCIDGYEIKFLDIGGLPLYNEDLDNDTPPQAWVDFRKEVADMDAYLFATPEYNRSVPAAIKNALDVASRPMGQNVWSGKPGAVISVSPGKISGFGANMILRQTLTFLNIYIMPQPEAYIGEVHKLLNEQGALIDKGTQEFLYKFSQAFMQWVERD